MTPASEPMRPVALLATPRALSLHPQVQLMEKLSQLASSDAGAAGATQPQPRSPLGLLSQSGERSADGVPEWLDGVRSSLASKVVPRCAQRWRLAFWRARECCHLVPARHLAAISGRGAVRPGPGCGGKQQLLDGGAARAQTQGTPRA